jgi:Sec-independent protein secretion pathway component TatC
MSALRKPRYEPDPEPRPRGSMHLLDHLEELRGRIIKYAVLIIFIVAAVLTPSSDPWNQTVFAAPMLVLYVLCIGLAWAVAPAPRRTP